MHQDKNVELPDIKKIMEFLPHRYPFLLVDRIIEMEADTRIVGIKNVTINEPFFTGHFPGEPVMPGVLLIEAMAQVGAVMVLSQPDNLGKIVYLAAVDKAKFRRPVTPGDQLRIEVKLSAIRHSIGKGFASVHVGDEPAAEAVLTFAVQK